MDNSTSETGPYERGRKPWHYRICEYCGKEFVTKSKTALSIHRVYRCPKKPDDGSTQTRLRKYGVENDEDASGDADDGQRDLSSFDD